MEGVGELVEVNKAGLRLYVGDKLIAMRSSEIWRQIAPAARGGA